MATRECDHLGALFVSVTGRSTITEPQRVDDRVLEDESASEISTYLHESVAATGLDDALGEPDVS